MNTETCSSIKVYKLNKYMPDITCCKGKKCPLKETCYRYKAKKGEYQSYFMKEPYKGKKCEYYWELNK